MLNFLPCWDEGNWATISRHLPTRDGAASHHCRGSLCIVGPAGMGQVADWGDSESYSSTRTTSCTRIWTGSNRCPSVAGVNASLKASTAHFKASASSSSTGSSSHKSWSQRSSTSISRFALIRTFLDLFRASLSGIRLRSRIQLIAKRVCFGDNS